MDLQNWCTQIPQPLRGDACFEWRFAWDLPPPSTKPKLPNADVKKVFKRSPKKGTLDPSTPDPEKCPERVQKVKGNLKIWISTTLLTWKKTFWTFGGSRFGGSKPPLGRLFETFRCLGFWTLCWWLESSQGFFLKILGKYHWRKKHYENNLKTISGM